MLLLQVMQSELKTTGKILEIKDGKIFDELRKGDDDRKKFFEKIIEVQTILGGDLNDVI